MIYKERISFIAAFKEYIQGIHIDYNVIICLHIELKMLRRLGGFLERAEGVARRGPLVAQQRRRGGPEDGLRLELRRRPHGRGRQPPAAGEGMRTLRVN